MSALMIRKKYSMTAPEVVDFYRSESICVDFTERRLRQLLFLSFGMLCIIQATLNVSLRLACEYAFGFV